MSDFFRVECRLSGALAGDPPHLDALLELALSVHHPKALDRVKVDRNVPAPPQGEIPIPILRRTLGSWSVARCSGPIYLGAFDRHEHYGKKLAVEEALLLAAGERKVVNTTGAYLKSYRLPLRVRNVARVVWFAEGDRYETLKVLRRVGAIGKKVSQGYGRVASWEAGRVGHDAVWWAGSAAGPVLMRPLPVGAWLPGGLIGCRPDYGACAPPYWHPDRYGEIVTPC